LKEATEGQVKTLCRALERRSMGTEDLVKLGQAKALKLNRTALLTQMGVPRSLRKALVKAVVNDLKANKTPKPSPKKVTRRKSEFVDAFKKAKAANKGKETFGWPDIELVAKVEVPEGGQKVSTTVIKAAHKMMPEPSTKPDPSTSKTATA